MTNQIKNLIDDYGAVGDGSTDDTTALQNALNAGGALYIPRPSVNYKITSPVTQTKLMTVIGDGGGSLINAVFSTTQNGAWKIALGSDAVRYGCLLQGFAITCNNSPAIYIDQTYAGSPANFLAKWKFDQLILTNSAGGYSFVINNTANDGFFCNKISNSYFLGGLNLVNIGDSNTIDNNTITGSGTGINITQQSGAANTSIRENNITNTGSAIYISGALNVFIEKNQIENTAPASMYGNLITTVGGITNIVIRQNNLNGHSLLNALIGMDSVSHGVIDENTLEGGLTSAMYVPSTCNNIHIGQRNINSCPTLYSPSPNSAIIVE
jgi:hypothetical protein